MAVLAVTAASSLGLGPHLDALDACYADLLAPTDALTTLAADADRLDRARQDYAQHGFVRFPGVVAADALDRLAVELWPILSKLAFAVRVPHRVVDGDLTGGGRLRRVDAASLDGQGQGKAMAEILRALGVVEFGELLAARIAGVTTRVLGSLGYERMFFNLYDEGDYLTAHDDAHMGDRVDVTFPVALDATSGLRVLAGGYLETHYDGSGAMSVLGPRVWHEVPPLLRAAGGPLPRRLTITMRYG